MKKLNEIKKTNSSTSAKDYSINKAESSANNITSGSAQ